MYFNLKTDVSAREKNRASPRQKERSAHTEDAGSEWSR